jgi:glycine/D-amino acid oxidase-like deaminating enzyme
MSSSSASRSLIVGAGLAGTLMAWELEKRGVEFEVWDNGASSASKVAAGMYNPLSFKRLVEVWNATPHIEAMHKTYCELQEFLGIKALHPTRCCKVDKPASFSRRSASRSYRTLRLRCSKRRWVGRRYTSHMRYASPFRERRAVPCEIMGYVNAS